MDNENTDYLWQRRHDIKVRALMNRMYYQERQRIFEVREGIVKAASILAGSIAFARVADQAIIQWCAAIITTASTLSLVFGYGQKARDSVKLSAEWARLEHEIDLIGERGFTEQQLNQWTAKAHEIEAGEPAAHKVLLEKCYERAVETLGGTATLKLNFFERHCPLLMIP
ncbi:hypothetical protein [Crenothrix polyspora]|uniref:SMODS and SLOG-associating 2TM effector domain-containing protein n=1 Tax=Crenothrix polyspora TaxID=360316 RepID=A0A1R4HG59_9GAMM|nr:hypothetical protein [Crenothrix polyspora]SJM94991.1 hypothetical protein CRENPOLYSF1_610042 [Crenothrix polyspora]